MAVAGMFIFASCKNENDAFKEAITSTNVEVLNKFLEDYPEASFERRDSVQVRLDDLYAQEEYYSVVIANEYLIDSYQTAENYLQAWPDGVYVKHMKRFVEKEKNAYESALAELYETRYGQFRDAMVNHIYGGAVFAAPDYNGEGVGAYTSRFGQRISIFRYQIKNNGRLDLELFGEYEFYTEDRCLEDCKSVFETYQEFLQRCPLFQAANGKKYNYKSGSWAPTYAEVIFYDRHMNFYDRRRGETDYYDKKYDVELYEQVIQMINDCLPKLNELVN